MATVMATAKTTTGKDNDDNGRGCPRQQARTTTLVRTATARMMVMTARTTGKDGEDNR
jgi:hypothetical protein